jgi:hypothetical protein
MKNFLLGMAAVIILGPIFREVLIKTNQKLKESTTD